VTSCSPTPSRVRKAYAEALAQYRELSRRSSFGESEWAGFLTALVSAAEFEFDVDGNGLETLLGEAAKVRERIGQMFPHAADDWLAELEGRISELESDREN
jgi:hypothetical protein